MRCPTRCGRCRCIELVGSAKYQQGVGERLKRRRRERRDAAAGPASHSLRLGGFSFLILVCPGSPHRNISLPKLQTVFSLRYADPFDYKGPELYGRCYYYYYYHPHQLRPLPHRTPEYHAIEWYHKYHTQNFSLHWGTLTNETTTRDKTQNRFQVEKFHSEMYCFSFFCKK